MGMLPRWMFPFLICPLLAIQPHTARAETPATAAKPCVGWVQEVRGTAYWRAAPSTPRKVLQPKADQYRGLRSGEQVLCARGSRLQLMLNGRLQEVKSAEGWVTIPPPVRTTGLTERAIEAYGRRLGAERPLGSALYSPAEGSRVRASRLVVRWQPDPAWKRITLALRDEAGQELWRRPRVEAASGHLEDQELRSRLQQRLTSASDSSLELQLITPDGASYTVHFSLLPSTEEASLAPELAAFDEGPGLLPRIGRAQTLIQYRLYNEAADEYEAALSQAPESRALLEKALQLQRLIGNSVRAEELEQRLVWGQKEE